MRRRFALIKKYSSFMPSEVYYVVTHMGDKHDYTSKIKAMDKLLGRPSAGQVMADKYGFVKEAGTPYDQRRVY